MPEPATTPSLSVILFEGSTSRTTITIWPSTTVAGLHLVRVVESVRRDAGEATDGSQAWHDEVLANDATPSTALRQLHRDLGAYLAALDARAPTT